jgi:hypothetical protein
MPMLLVVSFYTLVAVVASWNPFGSSAVPGYFKLAKSDVPFHSMGVVCNASASASASADCTLSTIAANCSANPKCQAFNTDGLLKAFASCSWGSEYCVYPQGQPFPAADRLDLYVKQGVPPPQEWRAEIIAGSTLYGHEETVNAAFMPQVGNGYVATVVASSAMYVSGVYFGACGPSHKARLPSPIAGISLTNRPYGFGAHEMMWPPIHTALDTRRGMFVRRYAVGVGADGGIVEQRILAHRTRPHLMLTEFELINGSGSSGSGSVELELQTRYQLQQDPGGRWSADVDAVSNSRSAQVLVNTGVVATENDDGIRPQVAIVADYIPASATLGKVGDVLRFMAVTVSSVGLAGSGSSSSNVTEVAMAEYTALKREYSRQPRHPMLVDEHVAAWAKLTRPRVEVGGAGGDYYAWKVQTQFWSSYYSLLSSIRDGWSYSGLTPGGLATDMYNGMVISPDEEIYMEGALLPFHPELAISAVQYRIDGGSAAKYNAKLFGHDGMQFPCNSAAKGFPHGCCEGKGTGTQCLSHHVTPTVVFSIQQAYRAIGNATWLREVAWPIVHGVSQWIVSRVTPHPPVSGEKLKFSLRGVEPIDQWCNPAIGCLSSGVDDDPFTNAVAATALRFAIETAGLVGWSNRSEVTQWQTVADGLIIRYNTSLGVHTMGPGVVAADEPHTFSCPEDVGYLSYPLGPSLNISAELRRRDLQYWQAYTCLENPGMTGPIQAINWLKVSPPNMTGAARVFSTEIYTRGVPLSFTPLLRLKRSCVRATNGMPFGRTPIYTR